MAWYSNIFGGNKAQEADMEKLNPIQQYFGNDKEGSREYTQNYEQFYETLEIVNRGVNMIVDDVAEIPVVVHPNQTNGVQKGIRRSTVNKLLNKEPNLFQDVSSFKRNLITDYLLDGNIFIYYDGAHLYHLPADSVTIHADPKTFIEKYTYNDVDYGPDEIIHVKENSFYSIFRGTSRLKPAVRTMALTASMRKFQDNFFKNGAVPGLVLKSPNTLSEKIKERMIQSWSIRYRPDAGGRRPLILDGGIEIDSISNVNFKELDFQSSITENETIILKALGIPPILLDSGNNANIRPNMRMYYLETILPIVRKINYAYSRFFGYEIKEEVIDIPALQPELRDQSQYYSSLVNGGIITINEARTRLGFESLEGQDDVRVPANIAGSAANPDEGGRPTEGDEDGSD
ncbi:MAG: phage portal protein [Euryarchaeota archaeon]|nr:phage portal protein [Euryarchaeota archaeon]